MNIVEKRDYIHSHLHQADDNIVNEFFEILRKEELLRAKLTARAEKSEKDILADRVFTRSEIERRLGSI